ALYEEYGGGKPPFSIRGGTGGHKDNCILCGLCVRVCAEVIGADAIGFANRGMKKVATPGLMRDSDRCIGCATCVLICPTQAIRVEDINSIAIGHRWGHEADHRHCRLCGSIVSTPEFFTDLGALRKQAGA
ncbi:MAG: 4Fe-4S dicluster domain-containing protein, partial [Deltaproteobacteria bacterium]|nr:4Fe-4S dicluster domain-containing protein [Deltaproteobacteria bacterium]